MFIRILTHPLKKLLISYIWESNQQAGNILAPINGILGRVRVTIFAAKKQDVLHILSVCSLSYSTCKAHVPYYIVIYGRPVCLYCIFSRIS